MAVSSSTAAPAFRVSWVARRALVLAAAVLTAVSVLVPVAAYFDARADRDVLRQTLVPGAQLDPSTQEFARELGRTARDAPPLVLSYHDIRPLEPDEDRDDIYTVTPEQFASHMAALRRAGFTSVSSGQMARWLDGERLPRRAVYITFDDGATGVWRYADSVLRRYDMRAAVFVITGRTGTHRPYYLTWSELRRMARSGRWDVESHTRDGHDRVQVTRGGDAEPFLINRMWLADGHRRETLDEAVERVSDDIAGSRRDLHRNGFVTPQFFAYPFSAETKPTNDERLPPIVADLIRDSFVAGLSNDEPDRLVSQRDRNRRSLSRVEVFRFTTATGLLSRINRALPLAPSGLRPIEHPADWVDSSGRRLVPPAHDETSGAMPSSPYASWTRFAGGELVVTPEPERFLAATFAPGRTEDWQHYQASVVAEDLGLPEQGPTASLAALDGSPTSVQLSVSAGFARLKVGSDVIADQSIPPAPAHQLEVRVRAGEVSALVDGVEVGATTVSPNSSGGVSLGTSSVGAGQPGVRFHSLTVDALVPPGPPREEASPRADDQHNEDDRPSRSDRSTTTTRRRGATSTTALHSAVSSTSTTAPGWYASTSLQPESTSTSTTTTAAPRSTSTSTTTTSATSSSTTTTTAQSTTTTESSTTTTTTSRRDE